MLWFAFILSPALAFVGRSSTVLAGDAEMEVSVYYLEEADFQSKKLLDVLPVNIEESVVMLKGQGDEDDAAIGFVPKAKKDDPKAKRCLWKVLRVDSTRALAGTLRASPCHYETDLKEVLHPTIWGQIARGTAKLYFKPNGDIHVFPTIFRLTH